MGRETLMRQTVELIDNTRSLTNSSMYYQPFIAFKLRPCSMKSHSMRSQLQESCHFMNKTVVVDGQATTT